PTARLHAQRRCAANNRRKRPRGSAARSTGSVSQLGALDPLAVALLGLTRFLQRDRDRLFSVLDLRPLGAAAVELATLEAPHLLLHHGLLAGLGFRLANRHLLSPPSRDVVAAVGRDAPGRDRRHYASLGPNVFGFFATLSRVASELTEGDFGRLTDLSTPGGDFRFSPSIRFLVMPLSWLKPFHEDGAQLTTEDAASQRCARNDADADVFGAHQGVHLIVDRLRRPLGGLDGFAVLGMLVDVLAPEGAQLAFELAERPRDLHFVPAVHHRPFCV